MAKQTTSFRLPEVTHKEISELAILFKESGAEVVERAIRYLYENKELAAQQDLERRLSQLRNEKKE